MANTKQIIAIAAPVSITAAETEGENKGPAKFSATFYTGGAMNLAGYDLPVVIDLAGLTRGNVLVANLDHDPSKRVGNFELANDGKTLVANGTATAKTAARDEVIGSAIEGYQWQASLEVSPQQIETLGKNKAAVVNGQTVTGPAYITRKGTLKGFGFVSHGADDNTTVAIAAAAAPKKGTNQMKVEVKTWIEGRFPSIAATIDTMTEAEVANWEADYEGREGVRKPAEKKILAGDSVSREMREVERQETLDKLTANFLADVHASFKTRQFLEGIASLKATAIEKDWSPDKYDTELVRQTIPFSRTVAAPKQHGQINEKILQAAICQVGNLQNIEKQFDDQTLQAAQDRFKGRIGLRQLIAICAQVNGYQGDGYDVTAEMLRYACGEAGAMRASTGFSTLTIPNILAPTANKYLLEGWGGGEETWKAVTDVVSVKDFKTINQYRLGGTLKYEKVGPTGELKHGVVSESSYSVKADTYGKMFAVSREHIINDDLSALTSVPRELGYGASEAFNEVFWTEFLGGVGGDYSSTSTGVMSSGAALATIAAAEAVFFGLTKPNGEPLTVMPSVILTPNGSYRNAQAAMAASVVTGGSTNVPATNVMAGAYNVVRSAYLSNTAYTNYSTVRWFLCAVRPGFAPIQTAFLNGQQAPTIETATADFNTLGIQMRGVHDFGCNRFEVVRGVVVGSGA